MAHEPFSCLAERNRAGAARCATRRCVHHLLLPERGWYHRKSVACRWRTASDMEAPYCERIDMSIRFNHTIIAARDRHVSATFFTHLFGLPEPTAWGPFVSVGLDEGVFLQFAEPDINDIQMQHYAFLVDDRSFDEIYARILQGGLEHWADPQATLPG